MPDGLRPMLVSELADRRALTRLVKAALRHEVAHVVLSAPPRRRGQHTIELVVPGNAPVSLVAEPEGDPTVDGTPLRLRPFDRAQAAALYALLEEAGRMESAPPAGAASERPPHDEDPWGDDVPERTMIDAELGPGPAQRRPDGGAPFAESLPPPPSSSDDVNFFDLDAIPAPTPSMLPPPPRAALPPARPPLGSVLHPEEIAALDEGWSDAKSGSIAPPGSAEATSAPDLEITGEESGNLEEYDNASDDNEDATLIARFASVRPPGLSEPPPRSQRDNAVSEPPPSHPSIEARDPLLGRAIATGKYELESLIGSGAAGAVYRARHRDLRRSVAIKVLHPHYQKDVAFMKRFLGEARVTAQLDHPNVTRVLDFGQEPDGLVYIVMEYLSGSTLQSVLSEETTLEPRRAIRILMQVCAALSAAHEHGIIHRDIKPDNIVLVPSRDDEGTAFDLVKVCDFGVAAIQDVNTEDADLHAGTNVICGTPEYMSPEQGRGAGLDARADIYACGITLYELVTGAPPFYGENPIITITRHAREEPERPTIAIPDLDPLLEDVILKAIQKDPADRQQTARELRQELKGLLDIQRLTPPPFGAPKSALLLPLKHGESGFLPAFAALTQGLRGEGPFVPGHQERAIAERTLKRTLDQVLAGRGDLTFARRDAPGVIGYHVVGGDGELEDLRTILPPQAVLTYGAQFIEHLARRGIAALTLREGITDDELVRALQLLGARDGSPQNLPQLFSERGIVHVSLVFPADVIGRNRKLSWTVGLAMSRLSRDLCFLASARSVSPKRQREGRIDAVASGARLMTRPEELRQFLANIDVLETVLHEHQAFPGSIAEALFDHVPKSRSLNAALLLLGDYDYRVAEQANIAGVTQILRLVAAQVAAERSSAGDELLRELGRRKIVQEHELPPDLALRVRGEAYVEAIAQNPAQALGALDEADSDEAFFAELQELESAIATLAKRGDAHALLAALATLARHAKSSTGRPGAREERALAVMKTVIDKERLIPIANVLLRGREEAREAAKTLLVQAGSAGASALVAAREKNGDREARAIFVQTMRDCGPATTHVLTQFLQRLGAGSGAPDPNLAEDMILSAPERRDAALGQELIKFAKHPKLGEAAIFTLVTVWPERARPLLVESLDHPDDAVRTRAFKELARLHAVDDGALAVVEKVLSTRTGLPESLRVAAAQSVAGVLPQSRARAVALLARLLEGKRGLVARFRGDDIEESPEVLVSMARSLLTLDRPEGMRVIKLRAGKSEPGLRAQLVALVSR